MSSCLRFDLELGTWEQMPSMQTERVDVSSCTLGGYLYVFPCDFKKRKYLNTIEKLRLFESANE